jgi:hypothetical protein
MEQGNGKSYTLAGWLAIASALLVLPVMLLSILLEIRKPALAPLLVLYIPVVLVQAGFAVYALHRFRALLNERFAFHEVDALVWLLIAGILAISIIGAVGKTVTVLLAGRALPIAIGFAVLVILIALPLSIVGIVFAVKLLRLRDDLWGLLKPFAYVQMAACILLATILLAPIGGLVDAVATFLMGMILLRADRGAQEVEFV